MAAPPRAATTTPSAGKRAATSLKVRLMVVSTPRSET
jgi:hypothetical protein